MSGANEFRRENRGKEIRDGFSSCVFVCLSVCKRKEKKKFEISIIFLFHYLIFYIMPFLTM